MEYFNTAAGLILTVCIGMNLILANKSDDLKAIKHALVAILYAIVVGIAILERHLT